MCFYLTLWEEQRLLFAPDPKLRKTSPSSRKPLPLPSPPFIPSPAPHNGPSPYKGSVLFCSDTGFLQPESEMTLSAMMSPSFSGLLLTCLLLPCLTQGHQEVPEPPSARSSCPQGFGFHGSHCYGVLGPETWNTAELLCQGYPSGHLGSLLNEAEATFVATMIKENKVKDPVWIGLHDPNKNRRWKWSSNALYLYKAWGKGFPATTDPNYCVILTPGSEFKNWRDESCQNEHLYLCKFKA